MEQENYSSLDKSLYLVNKELGIPSSQIAVAHRSKYLTCLVHESWLSNISKGIGETIIYPGSDYEINLLLQSSHAPPSPPWHRVSITVVHKQSKSVESPSCHTYKTSLEEQQLNNNEIPQTVSEILDYVNRRNQVHSLEDALRRYSDNNFLISTTNNYQHSKFEDVVKQAIKEVHQLSTTQFVQCSGKECSENKKESNNHVETNIFQEANDESVSKYSSNQLQSEFDQANFSENILPLICAIESEDAFFFVFPYLQYTLFDLVMFSPAVLSASHIRALFIIYQLLHAIQWYHKNMLTCGHVTLHDVKMFEGIWIFLQWFDLSCLPPCDCSYSRDNNSCSVTASELEPCKAKLNQSEDRQLQNVEYKQRKLNHLVDEWVTGKISNYDYLMALNQAAGRRVGDPNYHPVFPWITDFLQQNGSYRDLTKSKYRLNKGDYQLDMTYKGVSQENESNSVPHHVSDVLSDITYHVYLARKTPKSVLCEHVRAKWVPNEYPSSMHRMYLWTPDECIPEFFSDPTIFKSIHTDLPDIELPTWSSSPEEFISQHREMLESDHVSRNLNHWIDLTFGYKLSSRASIKAKNVCLHLVDKHQFITNHGVVQLFSKPHPSRMSSTPLLSTHLLSSKIHVQNQLLDDSKLNTLQSNHRVESVKVAIEDTPLSFGEGCDLSIEESDFMIGDIMDEKNENNKNKTQNTAGDAIKEKQTAVDNGEERLVSSMAIILPENFNPMEYLDNLESVKSFKSQFRFPENRKLEILPKRLSDTENFAEAARRDLQALGCLIVEMFASDKLRLVSSSLTSANRLQVITDLCLSSSKILPRFVRKGVLALLGRSEGKDGLPPLTPSLLLNQKLELFPFPEYFGQLHSFLGGYCRESLMDYNANEVSQDMESSNSLHSCLKMEFCFQDRKASGYTKRQVDFAVSELPSLIPLLDEEGLQLLLYHLEPLFNCSVVQLYAFTQLFDLLAQACGPKVTCKVFMKPLVKLFDSHLMANYENILTQSFISQMIVRFRLEQFLSHFINFIVDAVAFKSIGDRESKIEHRSSGINLEKSENNQKDFEVQTEDRSSLDELGYQTDHIHKEQSRESLEGSVSDNQITRDELNVSIFSDNLEEDEIDRAQRLLADKEDDEEDYDDPWKVWPVENEGKGLDETSASEQSETQLSQDLSLEENQSDKEDKNLEVGIITNHEKSSMDKTESINIHILDEKQEMKQEEPPGAELCKDVPTTDLNVELSANEETEENIDSEMSSRKSGDQDDDNEDEQDESSTSDNDEKQEDGEQPSELPLGSAKEELASGNDSGTYGSPFKESTLDLVATTPKATIEKPKKELTPGVISELASESVTWLAPRLGPVLTSRYLVSQLLHMLARCYMGRVGISAELDEEFEVDDRNARWVLFCLGHFCTLYGEAFMIYQYLPFVEKVIKGIHSSVSSRNEAAVAGVLALLKYCLPYMSKECLTDHFDMVSHGVFQPLLRILASSNLKFPGGGSARAALCHSYVDLLTALSQKLERELTRDLMTPLVQQFFSCFELVHMKKKVYKLGASSFTAVSSIEHRINVEDQRMEIENKEKNDPTSDSTWNETNPGLTGPEQMEAFYKTSFYEELCQTFSAAMAHNAYVPLCGIMGSKFIEGQLYNHELIWNLCCKYDPKLSHPTIEQGTNLESGDNRTYCGEMQNEAQTEDISQKQNAEVNSAPDFALKRLKDKNEEVTSGGGDGGGKPSTATRTPSLRFRGRKRYRKESTEKQDAKDKEDRWSLSASDQYLRGSWLEHWQHHLELKGKARKFDFKEMKLQTFTGHSGSVRAMCIQDSEHYFLSASKDKTVKLWSLSNHGDGTAQSASSCTYYYHTRSVFAVDMIESQRHAASCDGTIHLWDPFNGHCLAVLETPKNNPVVAMTAMPAPSSSVVAAMAESTLRFVDARIGKFAQEWKISTSNVAGSVRDICCSPDGHWVAVGFATGLVSVIDVRGGLLRTQRRAHTSDILQVKAFSPTSLLTSSVDQGVFLWKEDGFRLRALRGHPESLNCMVVFKDHVISASTNNRIGVHIVPEESSVSEVTYTSYKPRTDMFRGNITSLSYLPLNHFLLLGSDTGNITLCA